VTSRSHGTTRFGATRRARTAALVFALLASCAIFAELLAADAPLVVVGRSGVEVMLAIRQRARYAGLTREAIDELHAADQVLWPLVRSGPERVTTPRLAASLEHPLGTDSDGRDVFAGLVHGARSALVRSLVLLVVSVALGVLLGGFAATVGGLWDEVVARPIEVIQAFPTVVVVAILSATMPGHSAWVLGLALTAARTAEVARVVRTDALRLMTMDHVVAARALGATWWRIIQRHVWPDVAGPVAAMAATAVPALIVLEASLAFLGVDLPTSWGTMIAKGFAPGGSSWAAAAALTALVVTASGAWVLAAEVERVLNPRSQRRAARQPRGAS